MSRSVKHPGEVPPGAGTDGRDRRWDAHRESRRAEFVAAAAAAVAEHGPGVHLVDIAAAAGVSKPVLYRYFADKDELLAATAGWAADRVVAAIVEVLSADLTPRQVVDQGVEAYLAEVDRQRNLFLMAVRLHDQGSVRTAKSRVAALLARALGDAFRAAGKDAGGAEPWAQALVGLGVSTAEWWLERQTMSRAAVAEYLAAFIWHAFDGISNEYFSTLDAPGGALHLIRPDHHQRKS